jgi:hypothetical protein
VLRRGAWVGKGGWRPGGPGEVPHGELFRQELVAGEAAVARPAFGIEEAEGRPPVRRPVVIPGDADLGLLPHDLPPEADPAAAPQLEAKPRDLQAGPERGGGIGRLEDEEERPGPAGERDEPGEAIGEIRWSSDTSVARSRPGGRRAPGGDGGRDGGDGGRDGGRRAPSGDDGRAPGGGRRGHGQVQDEDVDGATLEERPGHGEGLVERAGGKDGEPLQPHPPGDRLDGIEAPGEVDPGDERAAGLGLRDGPQGERRRTARPGAAQRDRAGPRQTAVRQERVEIREAGGDHPAPVACRLPGERPGRGGPGSSPARQRNEGGTRRGGPRERLRAVAGKHRDRPGLRRERGGRQRPEDLQRGPRRGRSPAGPEAREGGGTVGMAVHRRPNNRTDVR